MKNTLLLIIITFFLGNLSAQTYIEIVDSTRINSSQSQRNQFLPTSFGSAKVQSLISEEELKAGGIHAGAEIIGIQWYVIIDNTPSATNFDLYLSDDYLNDTLPSGGKFASNPLVQVGVNLSDTGTYTGWHTATFTNSHIWDGQDNLIIQTCRAGTNQSGDDRISVFGNIGNTTTTNSKFVTGYFNSCNSNQGIYSLEGRAHMRIIANCSPSSSSISRTADCSTGYTTPSGKILYTSGLHIDTIANSTGCDSLISINLTITNIPTPTANALQIYAGTGTIADLTATGTNLVWYDSLTGGTVLPLTTALNDSTTYFVSQTNACGESGRTAVLVNRISDSSQTLCTPATVADLITTPSPGATVSWYNSATGGSPLADTTPLTSGSYYVSEGKETTVSTFAGSSLGYADGTGAAAQFNFPTSVTVDASGNIYVADLSNQKIRKITPAGVVTTLAGSTAGYTDGTGASAQFNDPSGVTVDASGNVYVADIWNHKIRKITPTGVVTTFAGSTQGYTDGTGASTRFNRPSGVAVDVSGNVYVADYGNHKIRKITSAGVVTTLAGSTGGYADGTGTSAQFNFPFGVAVDASGNVIVADYLNHKIRKITPAGVVTTLAGSTSGYADGNGTSAQFNRPASATVDASGNVYVADIFNSKIRKITPAGVVTTFAGSTAGYADGTVTSAKLNLPYGVVVDASENVYVADYGNHKIRKITQGSLSNRVLVEVRVNQPTTNIVTTSVCNSYTGASGTVWTISGTYTDTIPNSKGCDSITTYNLTINHKTTNSITTTVCNSYTGASGTVWIASGTYMDTIPNAVGCDSITTYNLSINYKTTNTITTSVCNPYTGSSGTVWTTSGTYIDTILNTKGCDSITTYNLTINTASTNTITTTACDSYTGASGATWTMSGTYLDTILNAKNCDSITTYNLTINYQTTNTVTASVCNSYTGLAGTTWTTSGTYMDTIPNSKGCDSITTYNLTINFYSTNTVTTTVCDSYTGLAGTTWTTSGTYIDTIQNPTGCDSITTYHLTINHSTTGTDAITACDSYTWINGVTYTASNNTATLTLTNALGCDSVVTLNLTIRYSTSSVDVLTSCGSYTWINGVTYTTSNNTATHTVSNAAGCDSIITLNLTVKPVNTIRRTKYSCFTYTVPETGNTYTVSGIYKDSTLNSVTGCYDFIITNLTINTVNAGIVSSNSGVLSVPANGDFYRWLDCDNDFIPVTFGDSNRFYTPNKNGNYACMVYTFEGCIDTTACFSINNVGVNDNKLTSSNVRVYPNPANNIVTISFNANNESYSVKLYNSIGKLIDERLTTSGQEQFDVSKLASGQYILVITDHNTSINKKVIITD